jgi:NAD-dependent deacetylase
VYPIAGLLPLAKHAGAPVVIVNGEPTAMDHLADAVIHNPLSEVLPLMCAVRRVHWDRVGPS